MRGIASFVAALTIAIVPSLALSVPASADSPARSCPAGKPVTAFRLLVEPPKGSEALPVAKVNLLEPGDRLEYEPGGTPGKGAKAKGPARVAILLASASGNEAGHIEVLEVKPASISDEWTVPVRASVVGLVYGPDGLSEHKINSLVKKDPDLVLKLTDYVEQTSKMEALVQTLSKYQQSAPGTSNLQASLAEFSSQYGVKMPAVSGTEPSGQQAQQLLQAINPAFSHDPLAQSSITQQSTGLAASVATFFMGPQFGIVAGGTVLLGQLHTALFPRAEFRAAFAQPTAPSGMDLCTGKPSEPKAHTRIAYLWALPMPNTGPPSIRLKDKVHIPTGWISTIGVTSATVEQLKLVERVRDWHLASATTDTAVPVKVSMGPESDFLSIDLTRAKLPSGEYHLTAKWDWTPITIEGTVDLMNFADYSTATLSPASRDQLVTGTGPVTLQLTGADFEFVNEVSLLRPAKASSIVARLPFSLPLGEEGGQQKSMTADLNASRLEPGSYLLRLTQLNGKTHDIPVTIHPANPVLDHLPIRVNLGQTEQAIDLHGTSLDHIEKITSDTAEWKLAPATGNPIGSGEREAIVHLSEKATEGQLIGAKVFVAGIDQPLDFSDVLRVAGPRPKIVSARKSFAAEGGIALREKEIPARSEVSFAIQGVHFDSRSRLHLECESPDDTLQKVDLTPGQRSGANELDSAGNGMLFLSINAGNVGQSGCALLATLTDADTGTSDPYSLGRIIRLPRIDKFSLTDEKLGDSLYAGILMGQDLQQIAKTGWDPKTSLPVAGIPTPVPGQPQEQTLKIAMPWPPPGPHASLYIWLSGETEARATSVKYQ